MDQQGNVADQLSYGGAYPPNQLTAPAPIGGVHPSVLSPGNQLAQHPLAYQQIQQQQLQHLQEQLQDFWATQHQDIEKVCDFKNHNLPLEMIKKIMKADEDVLMISAEAPIVFARACEMFILELTLRPDDQASPQYHKQHLVLLIWVITRPMGVQRWRLRLAMHRWGIQKHWRTG